MEKIVWLMLFISGLTYGQKVKSIPDSYNFEHLTVKEGLSQSSVLCSFQDRFGFMWFGTRDGINLYDGYHFKVFRNEIGNDKSLSSNIINDISEDTSHRIWIATQNGLSLYDRANNHFYNYVVEEGLAVRKILVDSNNNIWVGGTFGLLRFDVEKKIFISVNPNNNANKNSESFSVNDIKEDREGRLWMATNSFRVFIYDQKSNDLQELSIRGAASDARIESLFLSDHKEIYLGTYGDGLYMIDKKGEVIQHYNQKRGNLSNDFIRSIIATNDHRIWIGTFEGLTIIDTNGQSKIFNSSPVNPKGLSHNSIRSLYKDHKGSVWIGTYFGGLNYYDTDNQRFIHYFNFSHNNISNHVIGAFTEDLNQQIYIGTEREGLYVFDQNHQHQKAVHTKSNYYSIIKSLYTDSKNRIWAGVFKQGLQMFDPDRQRFISYPVHQSGYHFLKDAIINCIIEEEQKLWIGTDGKGGLHLFDPEQKLFLKYPHQERINKLLRFTVVKQILTDPQNIYIATHGKGLLIFNKYTGAIKQISRFSIENTMVDSDEINGIFRDEKGIFWLATNGNGIITGDLSRNRYQRFDTRNQLSNNIVFGILEDNKKHIWAITRSGLSKINRLTQQIEQNYTHESGLPLQEINEGAYYKTSSGLFLIGGNTGYTSFRPENLSNNEYQPKLAFTDIRILNESISPEKFPKVLNEGINQTKKITLNYFQSVITFEFAAFNFLNSENNNYKYKLEGFDKEWVDIRQQRNVTYTNLKSGNYTFKVLASNNDQIWTEVPLEMELQILPPPWRTWWAYLIYTTMIIIGFYIIRYNAIKSTQLKHELKIEQLEKEKWKEVHELKLKYFTDVSHEFRTPLSLLIAPLEALMEEKIKYPELNKPVETMHFNAKRLLLLINQILEIREIESGYSTIKNQPVYIPYLFEQIVNSFQPLAKKKRIDLQISCSLSGQKPVLTDQDKLEKIIYNLLSNAFKFTPSKGTIEAKLYSEETDQNISYTITITDNGIGISREDLPKIFERFFKNDHSLNGAGIGLSLTKSFVDLMNGTIEVKSEEKKGTAFAVKLQFIKSSEIIETKDESNYQQPVPLVNSRKERKQYLENEEDVLKTRPLILIVEDNKDLRNYLKEMLSDRYFVQTAKDGKKGLEKAKKISPELIITDVSMPEMNGLELCHLIKSDPSLSHIPVLILTAKTTDTDRLLGLEAAADDYVTKPFNTTELKARIKSLLKNRQLVQVRFTEGQIKTDANDKILNSKDEEFMTQLDEIIQKQMDNPDLSIDAISEEMHMSRIHLFRKIKQITGSSPTDYVKNKKMDQAASLLRDKKFKISEIALMVGYTDVKYFSKMFKTHYSKTPTEFIREL